MKIWPLVVIFLLIGAYIIWDANNINIKDSDDRTNFLTRFAKWIFNLGGNIKDIAGYAVKLNWLPTEKYLNESFEE